MTSEHTVRRYQVRVGRVTWGDFYLDGNTLLIHSDFGSYASRWGRPGKEIRRFLIDCETDYVARKLVPSFWRRPVDPEATIRCVRQRLLERRREGAITREFARKEWDLVGNVEDEISLHAWWHETELENASFLIESIEIPPALSGMFKWLWPTFIEQLKAELAEEEERGPSPPGDFYLSPEERA